MPEGVGYGKKARASVSQAKAKKILSDGSVKGKPLSPKQKRFFGAIAGGRRGKSSRDNIREGMTKAADGALVTKARNGDEVAEGEPTKRRMSEAKTAILHGMQDGGGIEQMQKQAAGMGGFPEQNGLQALADALAPLAEAERQQRIQAMVLGLQSAQNFQGPLQPPMTFQDLLIQEVTRAFGALQQPRGPGGALPQVPVQGPAGPQVIPARGP